MDRSRKTMHESEHEHVTATLVRMLAHYVRNISRRPHKTTTTLKQLTPSTPQLSSLSSLYSCSLLPLRKLDDIKCPQKFAPAAPTRYSLKFPLQLDVHIARLSHLINHDSSRSHVLDMHLEDSTYPDSGDSCSNGLKAPARSTKIRFPTPPTT